MIAGGSSEYCANAMSPASAQSISFDASPGADHSLVIEKTNFPRVVRLAALLPALLPPFTGLLLVRCALSWQEALLAWYPTGSNS